MAPSIVYSPKYTMHGLGFDRLHPFDLHKYRRAWEEIRRRLGDRAEALRVAPEGPVGEDELRLVHTGAYLESLRDSRVIAAAVEVGPVAMVPWRVLERALLRPMRWATAGTVLGARLALEGGEAVNLGGGFHHASRDRAEGFNLYADIPVAIAVVRGERARTDGAEGGGSKSRHGPEGRGTPVRVVCVDLDVHMGNGVARCLRGDRESFIFDVFNEGIYPHDPEARARIDAAFGVRSGTGGAEYLELLRAELPRFLDSVVAAEGPTVAFYNAGTDVFAGDVLGGLELSFEDVVARDRFVIECFRARGIGWVMVPSGGYSGESWRMVAETVCWSVGATS